MSGTRANSLTAFWAIVMDTWRQSRQQVVFIILIVAMAVAAIAGIVIPGSVEQDGERRFAFVWDDSPSVMMEQAWVDTYAGTLMDEEDQKVMARLIMAEQSGAEPDVTEEELERLVDKQRDAVEEAVEKSKDISGARKGTEMFLVGLANAIFFIAMPLFLAACAGYYPGLLESGAVDIVLAKPLDRLRIFLGKFVGGLLLFGALLAITYTLVFLGVGIKTGVWHPKLFMVMPLQLFSAAVLYAILAWLGIRSRSQTLCLVVGLVFYFLVDTILGSLMDLQRLGIFEGMAWFDSVVGWMRYLLPNFAALKQTAAVSVLNIPLFEWSPIFVAGAWMLLMLGLGYWRFWRTDY